MTKTHTWKRVKWAGNDAEPYASWECWKYRQVTLYPSQFAQGQWSYVASFGANSERSHSGSFSEPLALEQAKANIERRYALNGF